MPATLYWHKADDLQGKVREDREKQERRIPKGQEETSGRNGHVYYLDSDDDFTGAYMCQNLSDFTH